MDKSLLGKILATVVTAAVDAGAIAIDPRGAIQNPDEISQIIKGFMEIWTTHPVGKA